MLEMHEVFTSVHLANRAYVCHYLNHINFRRIEGLLRSTKPLPSDARITDGVNVSLAIVSPTRSTLLCEGQFDPRQVTIKGMWSVKYAGSRTEDGNNDSGVHHGEGGDNENDGDTDGGVSGVYKSDVDSDDSADHENRDIFTSQRSLPISFASGTSSMGLPLILLGLSLEKGGRLR